MRLANACCGADVPTLFVSSAHPGMTARGRGAAPLSGALFAQTLAVRGLPASRFLHR